MPENSNVQESDITNLNKVLRALEFINRRLWMVKYFESSKSELEKELIEQKRKQEVDKLFQN